MHIARATVCVLALCCAAVAVCTADDALLRQAWMYAPGAKQEELATARERFALLVAGWAGEPAVAAQPETNESALWLLSHRQATYLVVDEQLGLPARGVARSAALYLAGRLSYRNLAARVAPMLPAARDNGERLDVIRCLSALQGQPSVEALVRFVESPPEGADEAAFVGAVQGLGQSRRPDVLPAILQAGVVIRSPAGAHEWAKAACRCGNAASMARIVAVVEDGRAARELRLDAVAFLCENFSDSALEALARLAAESDDEGLRLAATWALVNGTGYGRPAPAPRAPSPEEGVSEPVPAPVGEALLPGDPAAAEPQPALPGLPPDLSRLSEQERRALVQKLMEWWNAEGRARAASRAQRDEVS